MKFSFSNFSSNVLNYFWDISKNVVLSIYFFFDSLVLFILLSLSYLENLALSFLFKNSINVFNSTFEFAIFFLNSRYFQINTFYLNFLNLNQVTKITSDVLIVVAFFSFFSTYLFTGSASVAFSNEGLWLSVLTLAVIYVFYYLRTLENAGKDAISQEIENLKKLMLKNSQLSNEVVSLEDSIINFQIQVVFILEAWFFVLSEFVTHQDNDHNSSVLHIENLLDNIFVDYLKDLTNLNLARENLNRVIALKDFNEEIVSEVFDNN